MSAKAEIVDYTATRFARGKAIQPDAKIPRPASIGEARKIIEEVFKSQPFGGWNKNERQIYFEMIGVSGTNSADDVRKIISEMEDSRMVLFED